MVKRSRWFEVIGGIAGAVAGVYIGYKKNGVTGAVIGGIIGGLGLSKVGNEIDFIAYQEDEFWNPHNFDEDIDDDFDDDDLFDDGEDAD